MRRRSIFAAPLVLVPDFARAHAISHGNIVIGHPWALPSRQSDGQVFFPMVNKGNTADQLIAARSGICALIELRRNNRYDDPPLAAIILAPGKPVPMRPTATHLRLAGLRRALGEYQAFRIVLDFLAAGEIEIEVLVEAMSGN